MQLLWKMFKKNQFEAHIDECGIEIGTPRGGYQYEVTKPAVLHIVMSGTGTLTFNQQQYLLKPGDLFLLCRGMKVHYESTLEAPWTYYWVGMSGKLVLDYLNRTSLYTQRIIQNKDTTAIRNIIDQICQRSVDYSTQNSDDIQHMRDLYELLYQLHQHFPKPFQEVKNEKYANVRDAIRYINDNYMHAISIHDVAKHVNVSRSYLYKMFKKHIDQSPQHYLIHIRMYHAAKLFKETDLQSQEIAYRVGYKDALLFSRAFKKHFGVNATQYRKDMQQR
ncbi:AraC family transcriptional regulator [Staphylococcus lutrae]|uniref:AraC family transcriptional regulator n=1 Tax=Staphylococcus lutrae TaxID=155085 RepID=A0AAC9RSS6_9STAP|nr:AraC family transcriptional regulator [Staphylococcus lutrae]ARJ50499.1 AraC family transcriptional regulator [Staphylococcus lutrae]PNZ37400.1 AraC family transcriptional regulator [Staphylococcus lutrae]